MTLYINKKIGKRNFTFTFEGNNLYDVVTESQKLSFGDVEKCGLCDSDNLILATHEARGYKYTAIRCLKCKAQLTLGRRKDNPDIFFLRKNDAGKLDWTPYAKPETSKETKTDKDTGLPF